MNNYYLRYRRNDAVKYVSHLDFVRVMGRSLRRANLPVAYSEGFNPHPLLTFALPLSVGYTSNCEIMEFALEENISCDAIMQRLSASLPCGIEIIYVKQGKSTMKKLVYAAYRVKCENIPQSTDEFLSMKEIIIDKKTKSGIKPTDIRADIKSISIENGELTMVLSAGSRANLKPEVVIAAMNKYIKNYQSGEAQYLREKITDENFNEID